MNMSYCRFQNTLQDLKDCYYNMDDIEDMSKDEKWAREKLIELCCEIAKDSEYFLSLEESEEE